MVWLPFQQPTLSQQIWSTLALPFVNARRVLDALTALPGLSFLLIPSMTSYTTWINILFFYMTWSTLVFSHSPLKIEVISTLMVRMFFYIGPSLLFLLFDGLLPSVAASLKAQEEVGLPIRKECKGPKWYKVGLWSIFNVATGVVVEAVVAVFFSKVLKIEALDAASMPPWPWAIAKDVFRGLLLREILQYTAHRYLLHEWSSRAQSSHRSWQHAVTASYSLVAHYDHPLPYLLARFLPAYLPALIFRFHLLTYNIFLLFISLEEAFAWSGYNTVPTNFLLGGIARRVDVHMLCQGDGNYGAWGLADWMMGTTVGQDVVEDAKEEAEKNNAKRRAEGVVDGVRGQGKTGRGRRRKNAG